MYVVKPSPAVSHHKPTWKFPPMFSHCIFSLPVLNYLSQWFGISLLSSLMLTPNSNNIWNVARIHTIFVEWINELGNWGRVDFAYISELLIPSSLLLKFFTFTSLFQWYLSFSVICFGYLYISLITPPTLQVPWSRYLSPKYAYIVCHPCCFINICWMNNSCPYITLLRIWAQYRFVELNWIHPFDIEMPKYLKRSKNELDYKVHEVRDCESVLFYIVSSRMMGEW